jgi:hypothetical protein
VADSVGIRTGLENVWIRIPAATTNLWGDVQLFSLPALTDGGIIDLHSYGDSEALSTNPRYVPNYARGLLDRRREIEAIACKNPFHNVCSG